MKKFRAILTITFLSMILLGMTSCEIERHAESDRNRHQKMENDHHKSGAVLIIQDNNREHRSDDDNHDH